MKVESVLREACVNSYTEAKLAQEKGANRIELCDNLAQGGTTPSYGTIEACIKKLSIPTSVMIRPNGDWNFIYTLDEVEIMLKDIGICKNLGADLHIAEVHALIHTYHMQSHSPLSEHSPHVS